MKTFRQFVLLFVLSIGLLAPVASFAQPSDDNRSDGFLQNAIDRCQPKMVKVYGAETGRIDGYTTGIIVSEDGQILTIQGVYLDGMQVRVVLPSGKEYPATISKRDREKQMALLKITAETPDYFKLSESEIGKKGDWVLTLSNAFKVAEKTEPLSAMIGIISLRTSMEARLNRRDVAYRGNLVVIDSISSNPGAGGGAVVTTDGELVGMIGKIINSSETNTRLNYAIPTRTLFEFVTGKKKELVAETEKPKGDADLGINLFKHGGRGGPAYIDRVIRGGPAQKSKLKPDDLIVTVNGEKVGNVRQYQEVLKTLEPEVEVLIVVKRGLELVRVPITPRSKK